MAAATVRDMTVRPTDYWRQSIAEEAQQIASGELDAECAGIAELFPESMLARTDEDQKSVV